MSEAIVRIAARGDGVTASGVFVPGTAPGDIVNEDGRIDVGPHRAAPPCRHFALRPAQGCGGCQLQHLDDESYAAFVFDRIGGALAEQRIDPPGFAAVHLSPQRTRRRASLKAERRGRHVAIGFNEAASHRIVDLRECHILHPGVFALVVPLRAALATVLDDHSRATVMLTLTDQGVDCLIEGRIADGLAAVEALGDFARAHGLARLSVDDGDGLVAHWCPVPPTVTLGGTPVAFPAGAFLQATADGEMALVAAVRDAIGGATRVADLFAGLGTFALAMPGRTNAIEGNRDAVAALRATRRIDVEHRDLFRRPLTVEDLVPYDAVVLDPPRAGASAQVAALAASRVPRIAYVSCNPVTFARDARALIDGGYRLSRITPVGQFRWSTHVELAAAFAR